MGTLPEGIVIEKAGRKEDRMVNDATEQATQAHWRISMKHYVLIKFHVN